MAKKEPTRKKPKAAAEVEDDVLSDAEKEKIKNNILKKQAAKRYRHKIMEEYGMAGAGEPSNVRGGSPETIEEKRLARGIRKEKRKKNTQKLLQRDKILMQLGVKVDEDLNEVLEDNEISPEDKVAAIQKIYMQVFEDNIERVREDLKNNFADLIDPLSTQIYNYSTAKDQLDSGEPSKGCCGNKPEARMKKAVAVIKRIVGDSL
jgi:hypothetical protein